MAELSYTQWMARVDRQLAALCGMTHDDLPDQTWRDWYDSEMSPREAAEETLINEGMDELL